jgi:hypothetical protein
MFEKFINYENECKVNINEYFNNRVFKLTEAQEKLVKMRQPYVPQESSKQKQKRLQEEENEKIWQEMNKKWEEENRPKLTKK